MAGLSSSHDSSDDKKKPLRKTKIQQQKKQSNINIFERTLNYHLVQVSYHKCYCLSTISDVLLCVGPILLSLNYFATCYFCLKILLHTIFICYNYFANIDHVDIGEYIFNNHTLHITTKSIFAFDE